VAQTARHGDHDLAIRPRLVRKLDWEMNKFFLVPRRIGKKCEKRVKNGIRLKKISAFRPN
jgi:hypothetical protein